MVVKIKFATGAGTLLTVWDIVFVQPVVVVTVRVTTCDNDVPAKVWVTLGDAG